MESFDLSYRLELMRQIYNTAESPEMMLFQLMDTVVPTSVVCNEACNSDTTHVNHTLTQLPQPVVEATTNGQTSSCKNPSRLSLANLLPSRLASYPNFMYSSFT